MGRRRSRHARVRACDAQRDHLDDGGGWPDARRRRRAPCAVVWCHTGSEQEANEALREARELQPALDAVQPMPYPTLQCAFDGLYEPGYQWYWRADFVKEISDEAVERHIEHASQNPTMLSTMHMYPIDGVTNGIGATE